MNKFLFFVAFAMKFAGCLRRMRRDGWIKARCEEGVRMKPPHGGRWRRGSGWRWWEGLGLPGFSVGGAANFPVRRVVVG